MLGTDGNDSKQYRRVGRRGAPVAEGKDCRSNIRILPVLILAAAMLMAVPFISAASSASGTVPWNGSVAADFDGGDGSAGNPYRIADGAQLAYLSYLVGDGNTLFNDPDVYYVLTADIVLNDTSDLNTWESTSPANAWIPIGNQGEPFVANLNGDGHTVFGVYFSDSSDPDGNFAGLFGYLDGTVQDLNVDESYILGRDNVGGIAGYVGINGSVISCTNAGTVTGGNASAGGIGGIAGYVDGVIIDCLNTGKVDAKNSQAAGGIAGFVNSNAGVTNSSNTGMIAGTAGVSGLSNSNTGIGGIAGFVAADANIDGCSNTGTIFTGTVTGSNLGGANGGIGGIAGSSYGLVANSYNTGTVSGTTQGTNGGTGGIAGSVSSTADSDSVIINCYNTGMVTGNNQGTNGGTGGIAGSIVDAYVINCYNTGTITNVDGKHGGIAGVAVSASISFSYFSGSTAGVGSGTASETCLSFTGSALAGSVSIPPFASTNNILNALNYRAYTETDHDLLFFKVSSGSVPYVFAEEPYFKVDFVTAGPAAAVQLIPEGGKVGATTLQSITGYTFNGWFTDDGSTTGDWGSAWDLGLDTVYSDMTLYAKYTLDVYGITYTELYTSTAPSKNTYTVLSTDLNAPGGGRNGYTFDGWLLDGLNIGLVIPVGRTGDIILEADWVGTIYTITYANMDEARNGDGNPSTYTPGSPIVLKDPSRNGYTFDGWKSNNDAGLPTTGIEPGTIGDLVFWAGWTIVTYNITYTNTDGAVDLIGNPSTYTVESDPILLGDPSKFGYTFAGWRLGGAGGAPVAEISSGTSGDLILWASWTPIQYNITYANMTDAANGHGNPSTYTIESPSIVLEDPSKNGYEFERWKANSDSGATATGIPQGSAGDRTFWAVWAIVTYEITYTNLDGAVNWPGNPTTYDVATSTFSLGSPVRTGYDFTGWKLGGSGGGDVTEITLGTSGDLILWASWTPIEYNITYANLNGVTNGNPATYNIEDTPFSLSDPGPRAGYNFNGWKVTNNAGAATTGIAEGLMGDRTFWATWVIDGYEIIYENMDGAKNYYTHPSEYTIETPTITLGDPTKEEGVFIEWRLGHASGDRITEILLGTSGDLTLWAVWFGDPYTMSFDPTGGSFVDDIEGTYGGTIPAPEDPSKNGYAFVGWFTEDGRATDDWGSEWVFDTDTLERDTTLYAKWDAVLYDITYENWEGMADDNPNPETYTIESRFTLQDLDPAGPGYTFAGWKLIDADGDDVTEIVPGGTGGITLWALWTCTVTFDPAGGSEVNGTVAAYGGTIEAPDAPSKDGHTFMGWYKADGTPWEFDTDAVFGHIELTALWEAIPPAGLPSIAYVAMAAGALALIGLAGYFVFLRKP